MNIYHDRYHTLILQLTSLLIKYVPHTVPDTINIFGFYNMDPGSDYPPPLEGRSEQIKDFPITQTTRRVCYTQSIYEDEEVEEDEFFSVILIIQDQSDDRTVINEFGRAVFTIRDNDDIGVLALSTNQFALHNIIVHIATVLVASMSLICDIIHCNLIVTLFLYI